MTTGNMVLPPTSSEHNPQRPTADNPDVTLSGRESGKRKQGDDPWQLRLHPHHIDSSMDQTHAIRQVYWNQQQTRSSNIGQHAFTYTNNYNTNDNDDLPTRTQPRLPAQLHHSQDTRPPSGHHKKRQRQDLVLQLEETRHVKLPLARAQTLARDQQQPLQHQAATVIQTAWRCFTGVSHFYSNLMHIILVQMLAWSRAAQGLVAC